MYDGARSSSSSAGTAGSSAGAAPGKRTLTSQLAPRAVTQASAALGHDFSNVGMHEDGQADALGTRAFARGDDVHFARGAYQPDTQDGAALIGHELAHVAQQREGRVPVQGERGGVAVNVDPALEAEADARGAEVAQGFDLDGFLDFDRGRRGAVTAPVAQGEDSAPEASGVTPEDATAAIEIAGFYLNRYGRISKEEKSPATLAAPLSLLFRACASTVLPVEERGGQFEQAVTGLAPALTAATPDRATEYTAGLAVVRGHLAAERQSQAGTGGDPLAEIMGVRGAIGQAGGIGEEAKELLTLTNTKRLAGMGKAVDWMALGEMVAGVAVEADAPPEYAKAAQLLGGASFDAGFQALDLGLTAWLAKDKLAEKPQGAEGFAKVLKATFDLTAATCRGILLVLGSAATLAQSVAENVDEEKVWATMAGDCAKGSKLIGSSLGTITGGLDIATNVIVLWNGAEGLAAADAMAAIAGGAASVLANGSKFLLDAGIVEAGGAGGVLAGEIAAIAGPLAVIIPLAWLGTKVLLLEIGKLTMQITAAMMSETFEDLITDGSALAREAEALGTALVAGADPAADPVTTQRVVEDRVDLVRRFAFQLQTRGTDGKDRTVKREVSALFRSTAMLDQTDPVAVATAARAVVVGLTTILDRSPELVAEEAGDPTFADRARKGTPAAEAPPADPTEAPEDTCPQE